MERFIPGLDHPQGYPQYEPTLRPEIREENEQESLNFQELIGNFAAQNRIGERSPSTPRRSRRLSGSEGSPSTLRRSSRLSGADGAMEGSPSTPKRSPGKRRADSHENKENSPAKRASPGQGPRPDHSSPPRAGLRELPNAVNRVGGRTLLARNFQDRLKELDDGMSVSDQILGCLNNGGSIANLKAIFNISPKAEFADAIQQIFKNPLEINYKRKLRQLLCQQLPSNRRFFQFEEAFEDRFPLPESVRFIVHNLQGRKAQDGKPPISLPCNVFDHPNQFIEYVKSKSQEEESFSEVLLVRCNMLKIEEEDDDELSVHITPLLLEKTEDGNFILIWSDSVADEGYLDDELNKIADHFGQAGQRLDILSFPNKSLGRQSNATDCSIFAIQDAISFSKHHDEIIQIAKHIIAQEQDSLRHAIQMLPHRFFWLAQKSALAGIVKANLDGEDLVKFNIKYEKHRANDPVAGKKQNFRASRIGDKYEGMIWHHIIMSS